MVRVCAFARSCIQRAIIAIPEPSTTKAICATTASVCWDRRRRRSNIERLSGFSGSRIRTLEDARSFEHRGQDSPAMARVPGLADGCHGPRRRIVPAQRDLHRVPALGYISRAGCFRNEPEHPGVRHFLDAPPVSRGSRGGGHHDGRGARSHTRSWWGSVHRYGAPR